MHNYYSLPIHPSHRMYLWFIYQERTYKFQCLPFGMPTAPRAFTKTLKPVLTVLRSMGCDLYSQHVITPTTEKVLQKIFAQVVHLLCSPSPCQCPIFLGAVLDSTTMTLSLPKPKLTKQGSWLHQFITEVFNTYTYKQCRIMGMQGKW